MIRHARILLTALSVLSACTQLPGDNSPSGDAIVGTPAPGSKFARIRIGMSKQEVENLIGSPTSQGAHATGKAYIPFYFGAGRALVDARYKNEGVLTYSMGSIGSGAFNIVGIQVDRSERGYAR